MKKKYNDGGVILLIGLIILILICTFIYFVTKDERAKQSRDEYQERADDLRQRIKDKENLISFLIIEIDRVRQLETFLIDQAISICRFAKLIVYATIAGICFVAFVFFNYSFWDSLLTAVGVFGLIYTGFTIYFLNKIGDFNVALKMVEDLVIVRIFKSHNYDPNHLRTLEVKLQSERSELAALKEAHTRYLENNN
jgi:uncharacterized membrane protein